MCIVPPSAVESGESVSGRLSLDDGKCYGEQQILAKIEGSGAECD
jgi:hypothetical protein